MLSKIFRRGNGPLTLSSGHVYRRGHDESSSGMNIHQKECNKLSDGNSSDSLVDVYNKLPYR